MNRCDTAWDARRGKAQTTAEALLDGILHQQCQDCWMQTKLGISQDKRLRLGHSMQAASNLPSGTTPFLGWHEGKCHGIEVECVGAFIMRVQFL